MAFTQQRTLMLCILLWLGGSPVEHSVVVVESFTPHHVARLTTRVSHPASISRSTRRQATVEEMRAEAQRVRLEAQLLEQRLTRTKIERLESKLENKNWLAKHPEEEEALEQQLQALQRKLVVDPKTTSKQPIGVSAVPVSNDVNKATTTDASSVRKAEVVTASTSSSNGAEKSTSLSTQTAVDSKPLSSPSTSPSSQIRQAALDNPISGFDQADLDAYLPVALELEATMPNNTTDEKIAAFQKTPELQEHFSNKIRAMLIKPMEDMQKLEELRSEFWRSRSRVEKENLRRQIAQLEKEVEKDGPFGYSDAVFVDIPPMPDEERQERLETVGELPSVLQALYTRRTNAPDGDIALAIELDHYEAQIQLLGQVQYIQPMTDETIAETRMAIESLPMTVRNHLAKKNGLESGQDTKALVNKLTDQKGGENGSEKTWSNMQDIVVMSGASDEESDDLDYIDRSRYAEEFYPSIARLEGKHPSQEEMDLFIREVVDPRAFMVESKPERVVGGWYLRGQNLLEGDEEEGVKLVSRLMERLEASPQLTDKVEFFYVPDPSPQSDEDFEMDNPFENILYVTGKDPATMYNNAGALTKLSVSTLGIALMAIFSLATVEMVPHLQERLDAALATGSDDLEWLTNIVTPVFVSMLSIYAVHEAGHGIIAARDKFKIGFGGAIPSVQTGFLGSITPLQSPPPSMKSMFDFAIAGPLLGFLTSLAFFVAGLQETASADMNEALDFPGLPTFLLRSSALCSELTEFFLGKGTLMPGVSLPTEAVLPLHPFAVAGYVGLIVNALALLPLGNTDGGRVSIAMFGRRFGYVISSFTAILLVLVGLFGLDESRTFLSYTLFALLWQRDLESPARNEVEELDFVRGGVGILSALFVCLTLVPFF